MGLSCMRGGGSYASKQLISGMNFSSRGLPHLWLSVWVLWGMNLATRMWNLLSFMKENLHVPFRCRVLDITGVRFCEQCQNIGFSIFIWKTGQVKVLSGFCYQVEQVCENGSSLWAPVSVRVQPGDKDRTVICKGNVKVQILTITGVGVTGNWLVRRTKPSWMRVIPSPKRPLSTPSRFHQQDAAVMNQEVDPHQNPRLAAPWPLCFNFRYISGLPMRWWSKRLLLLSHFSRVRLCVTP